MQNDMRDRLVETLLQKTCHYSDTPCEQECGICGKIELYRSDIERLADHLIANDVVPVVRCKDCTEWDKDECECSHWYGFKENDFCSYGERKTNNE